MRVMAEEELIFSLTSGFHGPILKKIFDAKMPWNCSNEFIVLSFRSNYICKLGSGIFGLAIFLILLLGVLFFVVGSLACKIRRMKRYVQYSVGVIFK